MASTILPVTKEKIPSVIGIDDQSNVVIGIPAREQGLHGRTNTYHFKTALGVAQDDSQYEARSDKRGRKLAGRPKPFWVRNPSTDSTKAFTPLEATREFLSHLIPNSGDGVQRLIVGEPPLEDTWRENYRKNIRQVLTDLGHEDPVFFPEPFAVYQYYRHVEKRISNTEEQQTVLVIDFGGGTFDCCAIRTTRSGELARGGAQSLPLGFRSCAFAGEAVDIELLEIAADRAKDGGVVFKDDPIARARESAQSLWAVENVKIQLSESVGKLQNVSSNQLKSVEEELTLPAGSFHSNELVKVTLTGKDLYEVVQRLWSRVWGKTLLECHRRSAKQIEGTIDHYDVILLAGGSAHLPHLDALIKKTLPNQISKKTQLVIGGYAGAAVAQGIAVECKEQADRRPELIHDRLVSCLLNDLYIRIGRNKEESLAPKVRHSRDIEANSDGLVYRSPGILVDSRIKCQIQHQYKPKGVLHFWFHGSKTGSDDPLNIASTRVRIPCDSAVDNKIELTLDIESDGTILPTFTFKQHGKNPQKVSGQPFNLGSERVEGTAYLGIDFGTCNSYVAKFVAPDSLVDQTEYPDYTVTRETSARLLSLDERCTELRDSGVLSRTNILKHAKRSQYDFVFHSNKIEGNLLSRGQTEGTLKSSTKGIPSKDEREALNLRDTYLWVLENFDECGAQTASFGREINRQLLSGIEKHEGAFRTENVSISGISYTPPPWGSVSEFMAKLSDEIRESVGRTSGLELSVRLHTKIVAIHPFVDGNGRTARLMMAAILLAHELPVVILNSDDKERYLDALKKSNDGSIDSLMVFFAELMEQSLQELETLPSAVDQSVGQEKGGPALRPEHRMPSKREVRKKRAGFLNDEERRTRDSRSRLVKTLKKKGKARKLIQRVAYTAWLSAFEMFRNELAAYAEALDNLEEFRDAGYEIQFSEFDILNEDRFESYWTRRDLSKTWFCSIEIRNAFTMESHGLMFQFDRWSKQMQALAPSAAPVCCSLGIGGQETGSWLPLREEPIKLREIGYSDGGLLYVDYDGRPIESGLADILDEVVADLVGE